MGEAMKLAKRESVHGIRYVVYMPDMGYDVFNADQMNAYGAMVFIEATFMGGKQIASAVA